MLAFKFETDPYDVELHGLMTSEQYTEAMENLNKKLRPSRAGAIDGALLVTGPLLVPLTLWGVRHRNQTKRRKRLLKEGIHEFNMQYQELVMRWNRQPAQSTLTIERRHQSSVVDDQQQDVYTSNEGFGGVEQEEVMHMVQATLVPVPDSRIARSGSQQQPQHPQLRQSQSQPRQQQQHQQQQQQIQRQPQQQQQQSQLQLQQQRQQQQQQFAGASVQQSGSRQVSTTASNNALV